MFSARDATHMSHALRLAERGLFTTQPNPRVGCVIADDHDVVGTGWHRRAGEAHAELLALRDAGERSLGATAYVTLEPCGLHGRTPPCADALIAAGIARVVMASTDAYQHAGDALARMRAAGILVETGLMHARARELNRGFFSRVERGRPWVRVKLAMSLDGRTALANGESRWISGEAARADVQRWRARSSAILTGSGTVLADDPRLTVRELADPESGDAIEFMPPLRVVLDRGLRTPPAAHLLEAGAPTLFVHGRGAQPIDARFAHVECIALEMHADRLDLHALLALLAARGVNELQVEAGPTLSGALFEAGLVDELLLYIAPVLLGDSARPLLGLPALADMHKRWRLRVIDERKLGEDWRVLLRPEVTT